MIASISLAFVAFRFSHARLRLVSPRIISNSDRSNIFFFLRELDEVALKVVSWTIRGDHDREFQSHLWMGNRFLAETQACLRPRRWRDHG